MIKLFSQQSSVLSVGRFFAVLMLASSFLLVGCESAPKRSAGDIEALKRVSFEDTPEGVRAILKEDVLFNSGSAEVKVDFNRIFEAIKPSFDKARYQIVIEGHTDSTGSVALNNKLSQQRADNVRALIISKQYSPARLVAKGLAATKPRKKPEITLEDQRLNRRVEFLYVGETKASIGADNVEQNVENEYDLIAKELTEGAKKVGGAVAGGAKKIGGIFDGIFGSDASKK